MRQRYAFMEDPRGVGLNEYDTDSVRELGNAKERSNRGGLNCLWQNVTWRRRDQISDTKRE